ncbi:hypothetical protein [Sutcliffiella horikoshii]|uniref:hypothetical protein n=1 Tax=Sutcliffiella horikoshii TaxID=79883 RepID=UPI003CEF2AB2
MEKYSFFNSVEGDRKYQASDFANFWKQFLTNGVYPYPSTNLQVLSNDSYTITVDAGHAMIQGYMYENTEAKDLTVEVADGVMNRIDAVVVQLDLSERKIQTLIKKGTPATEPVRPSLTRTDTIYEIAIAELYIGKNAASISQMQIVDLRMNTEVCGWVNSTIQVDTTAIFNQYQDWYNQKTAEYEEEFQEWFQVQKDAIGHEDHAVMNDRLTALETEDLNIYQSIQGISYDISDLGGRVGQLESRFKPFIQRFVSDQTTVIPPLSYTIIKFGTQTQKNWKSNTDAYVCPVKGYYIFSSAMNFDKLDVAGTSSNNFYTRLYLNGNPVFGSIGVVPDAIDDGTGTDTWMMECNAGDEIQIAGYSSQGSEVRPSWTTFHAAFLGDNEDEIPGIYF